MGALPSCEANESPSSLQFSRCGAYLVAHIPLTPHFFPAAQSRAFRQLCRARKSQSPVYCFDVQNLGNYLPGEAAETFRAAQREEWGEEVRERDPGVCYADEDETAHHAAGAVVYDATSLYNVLVQQPTATQLMQSNSEMCDMYAREEQWHERVKRACLQVVTSPCCSTGTLANRQHLAQLQAEDMDSGQTKHGSHHPCEQSRCSHHHSGTEANRGTKCRRSCEESGTMHTPAGMDETEWEMEKIIQASGDPPAVFLHPLPAAMAVRISAEEEAAARARHRRRRCRCPCPSHRDAASAGRNEGGVARSTCDPSTRQCPCAHRAALPSPERHAEGAEEGGGGTVCATPNGPDSSTPSTTCSRGRGSAESEQEEEEESHALGRCGTSRRGAEDRRACPAWEEAGAPRDAVAAAAASAATHSTSGIRPSCCCGGGGGDDGGIARCATTGHPVPPAWGNVAAGRDGSRGGSRTHAESADDRAAPHTPPTHPPYRIATDATLCDGKAHLVAECGVLYLLAYAPHVTSPCAASQTDCFALPVTPVRIVGMQGFLPARTRGPAWLRRRGGGPVGSAHSPGDTVCLLHDAVVERAVRVPPVLRFCRFVAGRIGHTVLNRCALVWILTYEAQCRAAGLPEALMRPFWSTATLSNIPTLQLIRECFLRVKTAMGEVEYGELALRQRLAHTDQSNDFAPCLHVWPSGQGRSGGGRDDDAAPAAEAVEATTNRTGDYAAETGRRDEDEMGLQVGATTDEEEAVRSDCDDPRDGHSCRRTSRRADHPRDSARGRDRKMRDHFRGSAVHAGEKGGWSPASPTPPLSRGASTSEHSSHRDSPKSHRDGAKSHRSRARRAHAGTRNSVFGIYSSRLEPLSLGELRREVELGPVESDRIVFDLLPRRVSTTTTMTTSVSHVVPDTATPELDRVRAAPSARSAQSVGNGRSRSHPCRGNSSPSRPNGRHGHATASSRSTPRRRRRRRSSLRVAACRGSRAGRHDGGPVRDDDRDGDGGPVRDDDRDGDGVPPTDTPCRAHGIPSCPPHPPPHEFGSDREAVTRAAMQRSLREHGMVLSTRGRYVLLRVQQESLRAICHYCSRAAAPVNIGAYSVPVDTTSVSYGGSVKLEPPPSPPPPPPPSAPFDGERCRVTDGGVPERTHAAALPRLVHMRRPNDVALMEEYMREGLVTVFGVSDVAMLGQRPSARHGLSKLLLPMGGHGEPDGAGAGHSVEQVVANSPGALSWASTAAAATPSTSTKAADAVRRDRKACGQPERAGNRPAAHAAPLSLDQQQQCERERAQHVSSYAAGAFCDGDLVVYNTGAQQWEPYEHVQMRRRLRGGGGGGGNGAATSHTRRCAADDDDDASATGVDGVAALHNSLWTRLLFVGLSELLLSWTKWVVDNRFYDNRRDGGWLRGGGTAGGEQLVRQGRYYMWSFRHCEQRYFYGVIPKFMRTKQRRRPARRQRRRAGAVIAAPAPAHTDSAHTRDDAVGRDGAARAVVGDEVEDGVGQSAAAEGAVVVRSTPLSYPTMAAEAAGPPSAWAHFPPAAAAAPPPPPPPPPSPSPSASSSMASSSCASLCAQFAELNSYYRNNGNTFIQDGKRHENCYYPPLLHAVVVVRSGGAGAALSSPWGTTNRTCRVARAPWSSGSYTGVRVYHGRTLHARLVSPTVGLSDGGRTGTGVGERGVTRAETPPSMRSGRDESVHDSGGGEGEDGRAGHKTFRVVAGRSREYRWNPYA